MLTGFTLQQIIIIHLKFITVYEAQRYKSEGRGSDFQWGHWDSSLVYPSGCNMALGSTQSVTDVNTTDISCGGGGTLPPSYAKCRTSGSLILPEPSGPIQACAGIYLVRGHVRISWSLLSPDFSC
jgi:hypothetical protein